MILVIDPSVSIIKLKIVSLKNKFSESNFEEINPEDIVNRIKSIKKNKKIKAIVFRIVYGSKNFNSLVEVNDKFLKQFKELVTEFPFYVPIIEMLIRTFHENCKGIKMFAMFETGFFNKLPKEEQYYAISLKLSKKYSFKRYGFHGIFHEFHAKKVGPNEKVVSIVFDKKTTVCSIYKNKPCSISLGYTPLEGIMSNTSCGDLDSGVVFYLMKNHKKSIFQIDDILKNQSGFKGITGYSLKMKDFMKLYGKDKKVNLAFDVYKNQVLKYIGEAIAILGGIDKIIISGQYVKVLLPVILNLLKSISFLGINLNPLPWGKNNDFLTITTKQSDVLISINNNSLFQIMAYTVAKKLKFLV